MEKPYLSDIEKQFEEETGKQVWLPTYSEKYQEERWYLNKEWCEWNYKRIDNFLEDILKKIKDKE